MSSRGEWRDKILSSFQKPMSQTLKVSVRVARVLTPLMTVIFGFVYSPLRKRKKKAIKAKSAMAFTTSDTDGSLYALSNMYSGTSTGRASCGTAGGSCLRKPSMQRPTGTRYFCESLWNGLGFPTSSMVLDTDASASVTD